jgi:MFS family permease
VRPPDARGEGQRPPGPSRPSAGRGARASARGGAARRSARGLGIASRATARAAVRGGVFTGRWFQRSTRSEGAGESGLANLIDLHAIHSAGDALLTVALANTLFFSVDVHQARSRVAIYLLVTMAPFAVVAPIVGPLLDRVRRGRRYALMTTLILRAFLAWVIAGAVGSHGAFALYPAAFGALVCSKAYGVSRSAVVPRVLPPDVSLVRGNARLTLWGVLCATVAAPIGQGLSWATGSPAWTLRLAAIVYLAGSAFALRLPSRVDSSEGEVPVRPRDTGPIMDFDTGTPSRSYPVGPDVNDEAAPHVGILRRILPPLRGVGPRMGLMLRANAGLRAFSGFLTLFLAFLIRTRPLGVFSANADLGVIVATAALGSVLGTTIGARLRARRSEPLAITALASTAVVCVITAIWFGLFTAALAMLVATTSQSLGKLGLDSVIQRDVDEDVRTSAFARSETVLQLSWVLGGFLAIVLPSNGALGLGLGAAVLVAVLAITVRAIHAAKAAPRRQPRGSSPAWH